MMIVAMDHIRRMLPFVQPITKSNLEGKKALCIVIITIDLFTVEQSIYINQEKIKAKLIRFFFDDAVMKMLRPDMLIAFMYQLPLIIVKEFGAVHRHHHFGHMA